jgi:uracil-DNA glycosylase
MDQTRSKNNLTNWQAIVNFSLLVNIFKQLETLYHQEVVFPKFNEMLRCFEECSLENLKVVILGQDPYHTNGMADGLAFSTKSEKLPPSLKNIFKELENDLKIKKINGDLTNWAHQGVLLLNTCLTVSEGKAFSHHYLNYEPFITEVIKKINTLKQPIVFCLWGKAAQRYTQYLTNNQHLVLMSAHPSPLSCHHGFFGSKPFSKINQYLINNNTHPIKWGE